MLRWTGDYVPQQAPVLALRFVPCSGEVQFELALNWESAWDRTWRENQREGLAARTNFQSTVLYFAILKV